MAVRKLTPEQRDALRSEIRTRLEAGDKLARIVADQAAKYSLSPFTIRWHVKKATSASGPAKRLGRRRVQRSLSKPARMPSKDRALLRLKEEFDRLLEKDIEIRRAHVDNLSQLQDLNLRISERLVQGLETVKRRELPRTKPSVDVGTRSPVPKGFELFGKRVKALRKAANLTLEEAAKRIGSHKGYVSGIETGKVSPPSAKFVAKFAQAYSVDEKELLRMALVEKAPRALRDELLRAFWPS